MNGQGIGPVLCDAYGRKITYLRVSVTDRCNLRCVYCMPEEGVRTRSHHELLRFEEVSRVVGVAVRLGIERVRITGGEPLVRKGLPSLVRMIAQTPGLRDLSMTTNGTLLAEHASDLAASGLRRVNVSLDTLRPCVYSKMTRCGDLDRALAGIAAAEASGLLPIRLNVVVVRGLNDDEIEDLARLTLEHPWDVRFIELMPFWGNGGRFGPQDVVTAGEVKDRVKAMGAMAEAHPWGCDDRDGAGNPSAPDRCTGLATDGDRAAGPASYMRLPGGIGRVGFISRERDGFCVLCNRLRLTADGKLLPCLLSDAAIDLRDAIRGGADDAAIARLIRRAVCLKPRSGASGTRANGEPRTPPLSDIGG